MFKPVIVTKPKPKSDSRDKAKRDNGQSGNSRQDTWNTDHLTPIYDRNGRLIGQIDQTTGYENERGR